ncbi:pentapeptide repeat-containing protein [Rhizobium mesosinicum]|uniref:Pentapeptide repeat-containing protein n=1 Tax=Rhizobium mesosinicum TaxID=335017 RepID=A0ABS7GMX6_9HYPH|nr:pentapeptide repeat-containing protein [Rhizobium mesosinicum]MBW9051011.1 pentapeptide repeat-containing protein [Rhizobium mesosinicum]
MDPSKDFRNVDLRHIDFGCADLSGFDFTLADMTGADLSRAKTANAIFTRTTVGGVKWPRDKKLLKRRGHYLPSHFHRAVVEDVVKFIGKEARVPEVKVSMPAGTGRSALLAALLERYEEAGLLGDVLIVVDTSSERDKLQDRLTEAFGPSIVAFPPRGKRARPSHARIEIVTASALSLWINAPERSALRLSRSLNCLVTYTLRSRRGEMGERFRKAFGTTFRLTFEADWEFLEVPAENYDLDFRYALSEALKDQLVEKAQTVQIQTELELMEAIRHEPVEAHGVIIVSDEIDIERFTEKLRADVSEDGLDWRLIPLKNMSPSSLERLGGVIHVVDASLAADCDLSDADFVVTVTRVPTLLTRALKYPRFKDNRVHTPVVYEMGRPLRTFSRDLLRKIRSEK